MKRTVWIAATLLTTGLICGCGAEQKESSNSTTKDKSQTTAPAVQQPATFASDTPKKAVSEFLDALRSGDKTTTEALLTKKAREETAAHDLVVEPPGAPGATYSIGRVQQGESEEGAAYVSCIWSETEDGTEFEVVWILRRENVGWRIAGMATQLPETDEPVILNFEDLSELEDAMREAEVAERAQGATTPPQGSTTLR